MSNRTEAHQELNAFRRKQDTALVISGKSLEVCLDYYEHEFMELATTCPAVVCCRCTPEQKAQVVRLIQQHTGKQTAAIGDGGNDVSMIQAASAGVGIVGKEYHLIVYYFCLSRVKGPVETESLMCSNSNMMIMLTEGTAGIFYIFLSSTVW